VAKPISPVDICNLALDRIAQTAIASIEDPNNDSEETMARWYDQTRRELLRSYVWNFAKGRTLITRTGTPDFDYTDKYLLPNDFVRVLSLGGYSEIDAIKNYDIEGKSILLNYGGATSVKLRYTKDIQDVSLFDALFIKLLYLHIAKNVCYKYTVKASIVEGLEAELTREELQAVSVDGQERPPRHRHESKVMNQRRGFSGPGGGNTANYNENDW